MLVIRAISCILVGGLYYYQRCVYSILDLYLHPPFSSELTVRSPMELYQRGSEYLITLRAR